MKEKKIFNKLSYIKLPLLIFCLSLSVRLWQLNSIPPAITHDELNYIINAKSIFKTGQNTPQTALGLLSFKEKSYDIVTAELPSILIAPIVGPLSFSLFNARLPYAVISSLIVVVLYLLLKSLLNQKIGMIAGLILVVNPWSFHFGRTAFENNFAVLFYLLGIYALTACKGWKILCAFPFFLLGFFSYLGAKPVFLPLVIVVCAWKFFIDKQKSIKPLAVMVGLSMVVTLLFMITLKFQPISVRGNELIFSQGSAASQWVDVRRRLSFSSPIQKIFANKLSYFENQIIETYLHAFSVDNLFLNGEGRGAYTFGIHGYFYYIEFLFLIIGLVALFAISKKNLVLFLLIIAVAPIPSVLSVVERSYVLRAGIMFPFLASIIAVGIYYLVTRFKHTRLIASAICILYFFSIANFFNIYFNEYPVYGSEGFFLSERILSRYIKLLTEVDPQIQIKVSSEEPKLEFQSYLFYTNIYDNAQVVKEINNNMKFKNYSYKNVQFIDRCLEGEGLKDKNTVWIYHNPVQCQKEEKPGPRIVSLKDAGSVFVIKNDILCQNYNLMQYSKVENMKDFEMETQDRETFCRKWISFL